MGRHTPSTTNQAVAEWLISTLSAEYPDAEYVTGCSIAGCVLYQLWTKANQGIRYEISEDNITVYTLNWEGRGWSQYTPYCVGTYELCDPSSLSDLSDAIKQLMALHS